jgi:predicted pyridoxine 5'-phosphate oxidase superfamily flavin-nucleotide-binding protein
VVRSRPTTAERKARALAKLAHEADVWVATASAEGRPALVPLSLTWDGERIVLATEAAHITAGNAAATGWRDSPSAALATSS